MGATLPAATAATFDEIAHSAREITAQRQARHGPLDADDPLDEPIARLLRQIEQLETDTS